MLVQWKTTGMSSKCKLWGVDQTCESGWSESDSKAERVVLVNGHEGLLRAEDGKFLTDEETIGLVTEEGYLRYAPDNQYEEYDAEHESDDPEVNARLQRPDKEEATENQGLQRVLPKRCRDRKKRDCPAFAGEDGVIEPEYGIPRPARTPGAPLPTPVKVEDATLMPLVPGAAIRADQETIDLTADSEDDSKALLIEYLKNNPPASQPRARSLRMPELPGEPEANFTNTMLAGTELRFINDDSKVVRREPLSRCSNPCMLSARAIPAFKLRSVLYWGLTVSVEGKEEIYFESDQMQEGYRVLKKEIMEHDCWKTKNHEAKSEAAGVTCVVAVRVWKTP